VLRLSRLVPPREIRAQRQREHPLVTKPDGKVAREQIGSLLTRNHHKRRSWTADKGRRNKQRTRREWNGNNRVAPGLQLGPHALKRLARK
jgi:hypothetical protein